MHPDLVSRWNNWLTDGLTDKFTDELLKKYQRKGECLLQRPQVNPEVKLRMNDVTKKRDENLPEIQRLAVSGLSAIGPAFSNLLE